MFRIMFWKAVNWLFPVTNTGDVMANFAFIRQLDNGRFGLLTDGHLVQDYSRARDARRGAQRLGLVIA